MHGTYPKPVALQGVRDHRVATIESVIFAHRMSSTYSLFLIRTVVCTSVPSSILVFTAAQTSSLLPRLTSAFRSTHTSSAL